MWVFLGASIFVIVLGAVLMLLEKCCCGGTVQIGKLLIRFESEDTFGLREPRISRQEPEATDVTIE